MKYQIHRRLSEEIREGCEGRVNVRINPRWFTFGNVYPDCTHQRILHMHEADSAGEMVERMIHRFCRRGISDSKVLSRWRSLRLGIISHYVCDFNCYVHTAAFDGTLREHRAYEQAQGCCPVGDGPHSLCSFYGVSDAGELTVLLDAFVRGREATSYSPERDLDYAASTATELAYTMLRLCLEQEVRPWWRRLPVVRRRPLSHAS